MGYCGLDRRRAPLLGDEIRACWEGGPFALAPTIPAARARLPVVDGAPVQQIEFVEVTVGAAARRRTRPSRATRRTAARSNHRAPIAPDEPRCSLEDPAV